MPMPKGALDRVTPELRIVTSDFPKLAHDLRAVDKELPKALRLALLEGAQLIVPGAKARISGFSPRIAATIRATATQRGASVRAGGRKAPHALPVEGAGGKATFRHPVFAHGPRSTWTWVDQATHPFLQPEVTAKLSAVAELLGERLDQLLLRAGFHQGT